ncbi:hypothetical protein [Streptomyces sp. YIM B13518]
MIETAVDEAALRLKELVRRVAGSREPLALTEEAGWWPSSSLPG